MTSDGFKNSATQVRSTVAVFTVRIYSSIVVDRL
jgi:hypothetical protein